MRITHSFFLIFLSFLFILSCQSTNTAETDETPDSPEAARPNILWLVTEDMGPYIPPFGDSTIQTPNLSWLASEGVRYPRLFSPSGVCAPSRAAIATGLYPSGFGANHMRTGSHTGDTGLPAYEAVPPPEAEMMSQILRKHGYFCSNNLKKDYQFQEPVTAWDESGPYAHWRHREEGQPFFSIINFTDTHESGLFEPYGFRKEEQRHYMSGDTTFDLSANRGRMSEDETPVHVSKDLDFPIPPYLPDNDVVRRDMWKLYNNIAEMDRQVGAVLEQLREDGLLENTIVFFYADHGGPLPRQKRLIYDSGLNSPMIIRFPGKEGAGSIDGQLLSFVDFAPTVLSLAGIEPPAYMDGKAFLGDHQVAEERDYIYAAADRFDEYTDAIRAVRSKDYKYIRNYRPEQGYYLPVSYRERIPTMKNLLEQRDAGTLDEFQAQWFRESKPEEELFDLENDPYELNNLAEDPEYASRVEKLSSEMDAWLSEIGDQPNLPERELIQQLWNGKDEKPSTEAPVIANNDGSVTISCPTEGASIGYKVISDGQEPDSWEVYTQPFTAPAGSQLMVQAHRIGYHPSEVAEVQLP